MMADLLDEDADIRSHLAVLGLGCALAERAGDQGSEAPAGGRE
jgi:hypothetical protein